MKSLAVHKNNIKNALSCKGEARHEWQAFGVAGEKEARAPMQFNLSCLHHPGACERKTLKHYSKNLAAKHCERIYDFLCAHTI